jgi:EMC6
MDPMGDVGVSGENAETSIGSPTGTAFTNLRSNEIVDPLVVHLNLSRIERIRSVMGIASGCTAGILGLTGLHGFGMFNRYRLSMITSN